MYNLFRFLFDVGWFRRNGSNKEIDCTTKKTIKQDFNAKIKKNRYTTKVLRIDFDRQKSVRDKNQADSTRTNEKP